MEKSRRLVVKIIAITVVGLFLVSSFSPAISEQIGVEYESNMNQNQKLISDESFDSSIGSNQMTCTVINETERDAIKSGRRHDILLEETDFKQKEEIDSTEESSRDWTDWSSGGWHSQTEETKYANQYNDSYSTGDDWAPWSTHGMQCDNYWNTSDSNHIYYTFYIDDIPIKDDSLEIGIYFKSVDNPFMPDIYGPELRVYNYNSGSWETAAHLIWGNPDNLIWTWVNSSNSNNYVSSNGKVLFNVWETGGGHVYLDTVGIRYESADEEIDKYDGLWVGDYLWDDGQYDTAKLYVDFDVGSDGDGTSVQVGGIAELYCVETEEWVDDYDSGWCSITDWEDEVYLWNVSAAGGQNGEYEFHLSFYDDMMNYEGGIIFSDFNLYPEEPANQDPVAEANGPYSGDVGQSISFSSSGSYDPDGSISSYHWTFGDGGSSNNANPSHSYSSSGTYDVQLIVTDNDGATDTDSTTASISSSPPPNQDPVADAGGPYNGDVGETITFDGSNSYDPDGSVTQYRWKWSSGDSWTSWSTSPTRTHSYSAEGTYTVTLQVMDNDGATDTDTAQVTIESALKFSWAVQDSGSPVIDNPVYRGRKARVFLWVENTGSVEQSFSYGLDCNGIDYYNARHDKISPDWDLNQKIKCTLSTGEDYNLGDLKNDTIGPNSQKSYGFNIERSFRFHDDIDPLNLIKDISIDALLTVIEELGGINTLPGALSFLGMIAPFFEVIHFVDYKYETIGDSQTSSEYDTIRVVVEPNEFMKYATEISSLIAGTSFTAIGIKSGVVTPPALVCFGGETVCVAITYWDEISSSIGGFFDDAGNLISDVGKGISNWYDSWSPFSFSKSFGNYTKIVNPKPIPQIDEFNNLSSERYNITQLFLKLASYSQASAISYQRCISAMKNGSGQWVMNQFQSYKYYMNQTYNIKKQLNPLLNDFLSNISEVDPTDIQQMKNYISENGLPPVEIKILEYYGFSDEFIQTFENKTLGLNNTLLCNATSYISEMLNSSEEIGKILMNNLSYNSLNISIIESNISFEPNIINYFDIDESIHCYIELENISDLTGCELLSAQINNQIEPLQISNSPGDYDDDGIDDFAIEYSTDDFLNLLDEGELLINIFGNISCTSGQYSIYSGSSTILINGEPPNIPSKPSGPILGERNINYNYSSSTIDPENSNIYYLFDWDDGNTSGWMGPFDSGHVCETSHYWKDGGYYNIRTKAKDMLGHESNWSENLTVKINVPPIANFTFSPSEPNDIEEVIFTDTSIDEDGNIINWSWDFDDGSTSTEQNPTHQFGDDGIYSVCLTVEDDDGATDTFCQDVSVSNVGPVANFTWSPEEPTTVDMIQFTDTSIDPGKGLVGWSWDFDDGSTSTEQNPTHQFGDDGIYSVCLTVEDDDGATDTFCQDVSVSNVGPVANFTWSPLNPTTQDDVQFTDTSVDSDGFVESWSWDFGDGNTSNDMNPSHNYSSEGTYNVSLTVIDDDGTSSNTVKAINISDLVEIIDINQTVFDRGFPIRHAVDGDWAGAQSFQPTTVSITKAEIYLRKFGTPEFDLVVEIREDDPQGSLVDSMSFSPSEVPSSWSWFEVDFTDVTVQPDTDYFIVCPPAPSGVTTSFGYEWGYAFGNQYDDGAFWFTRDGGGLWRDLPAMYEFAFRIHGLGTVADYPPVADYSWIDADGAGIGTVIDFDASSSTDDNGINLYEWDWTNDGIYDHSSSNPTASYDYGDTSTHQCKLRVTDTNSQTDIKIKTVQATVESGTTTILFEGFEDEGCPSGWLNIDDDGDSYDWNCSWIHEVYNGSECAASASYINDIGALNPDNWLISPALDFTGYNSIMLSYWVAAQDPDWPSDHLEVWVSTTGTDIADFTDQVEDYTETDDIWKQRTVDLSSYAGETIHLAWRHCECTDMYWIKIDDIKVTASGGDLPVLAYSPTSYDFGTVNEGQTYQTTFDIWNSGTGSLSWSLSDTVSWLSYTPTSGSSTGETDTVIITIDTTGLSAGSYSESISISSNGGSGTFDVSFNIPGTGDTFYAYNCYDSSMDEGPISFPSDDPGSVTLLSATESDEFISGGCWADGVWYACEYNRSHLWTIDESTGDMTLVSSSSIFSGTGLAYDPVSDTLYGCTASDLYSIDTSSGVETHIGSFLGDPLFIGIAMDDSGNMYGLDLDDDSIYEIDTSTASTTLIGDTGLTLNYAQDIAYDKDTDQLYLAAYVDTGKGLGKSYEKSARELKGFGALYLCDTTDGSTTYVDDFGVTEVTGFAIPYI